MARRPRPGGTKVPKTSFVYIRVRPDQRALLEEAAELEVLDLSDWARQLLVKAAKAQVASAKRAAAKLEASDNVGDEAKQSPEKAAED